MTKRLDPQLKAARAAARKEARAAVLIAHREWWADVLAERQTYAVMMDDGSQRVLSPNSKQGPAIIHKDGLSYNEFAKWCLENGIPCSLEPGMPSRYRWRAPAVKAEPVDDHQRFMIRLRWH